MKETVSWVILWLIFWHKLHYRLQTTILPSNQMYSPEVLNFMEIREYVSFYLEMLLYSKTKAWKKVLGASIEKIIVNSSAHSSLARTGHMAPTSLQERIGNVVFSVSISLNKIRTNVTALSIINHNCNLLDLKVGLTLGLFGFLRVKPVPSTFLSIYIQYLKNCCRKSYWLGNSKNYVIVLV